MSSGWDALTAAVAEAQALVATVAPDAATAAEGEAYVTRVMSSALAGAVLGHLLHEDGVFRPLPTHGGPNPDYVMRHAPIDPGGRYRLEGRLNGSERVGVGLYAFGPNAAPLLRGYAVFDAANAAADGGFTLEIGGDAPGALTIAADVRVVLARILHRDPAREPARLRLAGGGPVKGLALAGGSHDAALAFAARSLGSTVREYLKWTTAVRAHPNRFEPAPPELAETVQGDPDTRYFLGSFDLEPGERLDVAMPQDIGGYWSVHAYNSWFEPLQTAGVHDRNAVPGADGRIRLAIGPDLPAGLANAVDTVGRTRGALICRIIGRGGCPTAAVRP